MSISQVPFSAEAVRADFPILSTQASSGADLVYLDSAASSQRPRQVIDCISDLYSRHYANVHRGIYTLSEDCTERFEQAREKVRAHLNAAGPEEIIFTRGTTESINLVARSWGDAFLSAGDEVLLTEMEHHANIVPWQQLAARRGVRVRFLPITDDGRLELSRLDEFLTQRTKIVAVTALSNVLGTENRLEPLIASAHAVGAKVLIDAAQSVPHQLTDVDRLGADFLAFSGHKMLGPTGIGVLWGRRALLEAMPPMLGGGSMIREVTLEGFTAADSPTRFEAGTPPIAPAIGLGAAIDYLNNVGLPAIHAHVKQLAAKAWERLNGLGYVRVLGPSPAERSSLVSFVVEGIHAHDIAQVLDRHGVAVRAGHHCTMPLHKRLGVSASVRASFYLYNTESDIDRLIEGIESAKRLFLDRASNRPRRRQ